VDTSLLTFPKKRFMVGAVDILPPLRVGLAPFFLLWVQQLHPGHRPAGGLLDPKGERGGGLAVASCDLSYERSRCPNESGKVPISNIFISTKFGDWMHGRYINIMLIVLSSKITLWK